MRDTGRAAGPNGLVSSANFTPPLVVAPHFVPARTNPVSKALSVPASAVRAPSYEATLKVIDTVHDDGRLVTIPLFENRATVNVGGYSWHGNTGAPIHIEVSRAGPHPELTLVHEIGHNLDHQTLDVRGAFASEMSPLMETWRRIVMATVTAKKLKAAAAGRKIDGRWAPGPVSDYQEALRFRELWARAYAQFVAKQSASPAP